ncbi:stevor PIR protein, putative [Plasmodium sp. gorilla clade G2]|uniref:stevor PIR protein, putative n=1 Tax=Plasmodium sp. gorilla clade G2 TaxID=880535 RepID=UPI000D1FEB38|nr:stevor PIR protein, putative [Plasmodium sp. gorilla clade G2]SOV11120.1 stevor PIR protein, putative [Plasmodium sp. gorilla clade G2]
MISYKFKLIIFSIILGALSLIYNVRNTLENHCDGLYKNINYKNTLLVPTKFRSLGELLYEPKTNHKHENNKLREYRNTNETNYMKKKYPKNHTKTKQNIPEVTQKENTLATNLKKYRKEIYGKENETQTNRSSRSLKYLEMQRKLYNNFYVKPETDFVHISDKSNAKNDKFCECPNKMKSFKKSSSSNKINDKYLYKLKTGCVGGVGVCALSSTAIGNSGIAAGVTAGIAPGTAAAKSFLTGIYSASIVPKLTEALSGVSLFSEPAIESALSSISTISSAHISCAATKAATAASGAAWGTFSAYGIAALVVILIAVVLIILYIWFYRRRKNSLKCEGKKRLCTKFAF